MRFYSLLGFVSLLIATPSFAAELVYGFSGKGQHFEQSGRTSSEPVLYGEGSVSGGILFNTDNAYFGDDGSLQVDGINPIGSGGQFTLNLLGDTLKFTHAYGDSGGTFWRATTTVWFTSGYLGSAFRNDLDFSEVISSYYLFTGRSNVGSGGYNFWGDGTLTSLSIRSELMFPFYASGTSLTAGVPEPSTWLMMLMGFGAIGATMRRRVSADARIA